MHHDASKRECIKLCQDCCTECERTLFGYCLPTGGKHAEAEHIKLMADCVEVCQTAANFMIRDSEFHQSICAACADVCEACARSCEQLDGDEMKRCADICRRCAERCREMGQMRKAA
jgi:hypothetical protein